VGAIQSLMSIPMLCTGCGLTINVTNIIARDGKLERWYPGQEDVEKYLCYTCYLEAPEEKKYLMEPYKTKPKKVKSIEKMEEADPFEDPIEENEKEEYKPTPTIEDQDPFAEVMEQEAERRSVI